MSLDVLDDQMITLADLQTKLNEAGLHQHYPKKNNTLLVKKSDIVKVRVGLDGNKVMVKGLFPDLGNTIQIVSTILFLVLSLTLNANGVIPWGIAIMGGQLISYLWYNPKIKALKAEVESALFVGR